MAIRISPKQRLLLMLLQEREKADRPVTRAEIARFTGWKEMGTVNAYLSKGNLDAFLTLVDGRDHSYEVNGTIGIDPLDFARRISQSQHQSEGEPESKSEEKTFSGKLLEKSVHAAVSAIEVYNKPDFKYREESFTILMVNAWEILLKAKFVLDSKEDLTCIYQYKNVNGKPELSLSRSGNPKSLGIFEVAKRLDVDLVLLENLNLLVEFRDNAIHLMNDSSRLGKKVQEIGTASLRSYVSLVNQWFNYDLSQYNFYIMPLSFFHTFELESVSVNRESEQHRNLLNYISSKERLFPSDEDKLHNISLILETRFTRSKTTEAIPFRNDPENPNALPMYQDSEERFAAKYKWTYANLVENLKERYSDFKKDKRFNQINAILKTNENYCGVRYLNFKEKKGTSQTWYDPNIIVEYDKHYTKK